MRLIKIRITSMWGNEANHLSNSPTWENQKPALRQKQIKAFFNEALILGADKHKLYHAGFFVYNWWLKINKSHIEDNAVALLKGRLKYENR